jgi:hypothetical protein
MKPLLFLTTIVLFLAYCTGTNHKVETDHKHPAASATTESTTVAHVDKDTKLTLNNGQKWKLDEPTRKNMTQIKQVVDKAAAQSSPNYHQVATDLQASSDKLIGECRMSGPDHDALHVWLEGYLPALKELHNDNKSIQKSAFQTIRTGVQQFGEYFE